MFEHEQTCTLKTVKCRYGVSCTQPMTALIPLTLSLSLIYRSYMVSPKETTSLCDPLLKTETVK
jgi:hypothetical protein